MLLFPLYDLSKFNARRPHNEFYQLCYLWWKCVKIYTHRLVYLNVSNHATTSFWNFSWFQLGSTTIFTNPVTSLFWGMLNIIKLGIWITFLLGSVSPFCSEIEGHQQDHCATAIQSSLRHLFKCLEQTFLISRGQAICSKTHLPTYLPTYLSWVLFAKRKISAKIKVYSLNFSRQH